MTTRGRWGARWRDGGEPEAEPEDRQQTAGVGAHDPRGRCTQPRVGARDPGVGEKGVSAIPGSVQATWGSIKKKTGVGDPGVGRRDPGVSEPSVFSDPGRRKGSPAAAAQAFVFVRWVL